MAVSPVFVETDFQRLVVERALVLAQELEATAGRAADGQVLGRCEGLLLTRGRAFLATCLQQAAQHSADEAGKKGGPREPVAGGGRVTKGRRRVRS